jgi:hypothetical protein
MSSTLKLLPSRAKLRSDNALPKCKKSKVDNDEPNRPRPWTANALPTLAKLRNASELPR